MEKKKDLIVFGVLLVFTGVIVYYGVEANMANPGSQAVWKIAVASCLLVMSFALGICGIVKTLKGKVNE